MSRIEFNISGLEFYITRLKEIKENSWNPIKEYEENIIEEKRRIDIGCT